MYIILILWCIWRQRNQPHLENYVPSARDTFALANEIRPSFPSTSNVYAEEKGLESDQSGLERTGIGFEAMASRASPNCMVFPFSEGGCVMGYKEAKMYMFWSRET